MKSTDRYTDGSYLDANPDWHEEHASWKAAQIVHVLTKAKIHPKSICDVGCGTGGVLDDLTIHFPHTTMVGYEISRQAVALRRQTDDGIEIVLDDFRRDSRTFDLVMAIDVVEHVEDYMGFLRDLHSKAPRAMFHIPLELSVYTVLRDKRTLINFRTGLGHLHHFSQATALAVLQDTGWDPRRMTITQGIFHHEQLDTRKRKLKWTPVAALARVSESAAAKVAGGFGLMVLADATSDPCGVGLPDARAAA